MAIEHALEVGVGAGAGELLARVNERPTVDRGTLAVGIGGITAGSFGPVMVNTAAGRSVFNDRAARSLGWTGLIGLWWAALRFIGVAPRISLAVPDEINLVNPLLTAILSSAATAGLVVFFPRVVVG